MLILAADTSTPFLSVALCRDAETIAERTEWADRQHAEQILQWVDSLLNQTSTALADIDLFAISVGPGSFTGLRVGVSAWKGLAAGIEKPLLGIPTLDGLATQKPLASGHLCTMLDAKMDEVYATVYSFGTNERRVIEPATVNSIDAVIPTCPADTLFIGDGATKYSEVLRKHFPSEQILATTYDAPRATAIAQEAYRRCQAEGGIPQEHVAPIYLRKSQAEENRDRQNAAASSS